MQYKMSSCFLARLKFYTARKCTEESIEQWTTRLHTLAEPCGFLQEKHVVLRDIFVIGLGPGTVQDRLHHEIDADSSVLLVILQQLAQEEETKWKTSESHYGGNKEPNVATKNLTVKKCVDYTNKMDLVSQHVNNKSNKIKVQFNINRENVEVSDSESQSCELNFPFNLKDRLSTFQGRKREIKLLHSSFQLLDRKIIVICGLCGTGKSELANEYAWEYKKYYKNNIVWIHYENDKQFESMFVDIAKQLDVKYDNWKKPVPRILVNGIYSTIAKKGGGLFVFDNVLARSLLNDYLPNDSCKNIRVLITSPYAKWANIKTINLTPLSEKETISIFKAVAKDTLSSKEQEDVVQMFPKILSGVPLVTQRFSIYIANECPRIEENFSFSQCIDQLEIHNILFDKPFPKWSEQNNQKTIYTSLVATLDNIQHLPENEDVAKMAIKITNFCAYCNFGSIPYSLLQNFSQSSSCFDSESTYKLLAAALTILVDLSLIFYENGNVQMNKLVQNIVLLHQKKCGTKSTWYSELLEFVLNTTDNCILLEKCVFSFVEEQKDTIFKVYKNSRNQEKLKQLLIKYEFQTTLNYICNSTKPEVININNKELPINDEQCTSSDKPSDSSDFSIHEAAENGHLDIIKLLISNDISLVYLHEKDEYECIPFHSAAIKGHVPILKYFLHEHQVPINIPNEAGSTAIHLTALNGRKNALSFLLEEGASLDVRNNNSLSILHMAGESKSVEIVEMVNAKGIPIDIRATLTGATPLHHAAFCDATDIVSYLIDKGADVNARNKANENALHYAAKEGYAKTIKILIEKGCSPQTENDNGYTPLVLAVMKNHLPVVKVFCENGCRPDKSSSKDGRTPMSVACREGCSQICDYFLKQFPDIYKRPKTNIKNAETYNYDGRVNNERNFNLI